MSVRTLHSSAANLNRNLHPSQPFSVTLVPSGHVSHLSPEIPGLHMHFPLICSQSDRTEPYGEQLQTEIKIFDLLIETFSKNINTNLNCTPIKKIHFHHSLFITLCKALPFLL